VDFLAAPIEIRPHERTQVMRFVSFARAALVLMSANIALVALSESVEAKQRYCRKEYCAKRVLVKPGSCGFLGRSCPPRRYQCVSTGVKIVKC
jgi:hypothetical protein